MSESVSILIIDQAMAVQSESKTVLYLKPDLERMLRCVEQNPLVVDAAFINFTEFEEVDAQGNFVREGATATLTALLEALKFRRIRLRVFCSEKSDLDRLVAWHRKYQPRGCDNIGLLPEITASELYEKYASQMLCA